METINDLAPFLPSHLQQGDYVALTFFVTTVAMASGAIFFFFQFFIAPKRWKNSILLMAMILTVASLNYFYMRDYWVETQISPTEFRYFDWLLTVPLICAEFYLLVRAFGFPRKRLWIMVFGSIWMLFFGYLGEAIDRENSLIYGLISTAGAILTIFQMGLGIEFASFQPLRSLRRGYITLFLFVLIFWNIYPIGYMTIPGNLLSNAFSPSTLDIMYNLGDIMNKVVFSIVLFMMIIHPSPDYQEEVYGEYKRELEAYKRSLKEKAEAARQAKAHAGAKSQEEANGYEVQPYENPTPEEEYI
ncbi:MAG: bacteriorhodopsin [Bacteroidota bacterium]